VTSDKIKELCLELVTYHLCQSRVENLCGLCVLNLCGLCVKKAFNRKDRKEKAVDLFLPLIRITEEEGM
jgi:hypothetical protein